MKEILEVLRKRSAHAELPFALATVVRVEGSSYRKPGARMLIGSMGRVSGSVSGGCLEKDVISRGLQVLLTGERQMAVYDTTDQDDMAFGASLGCEGRIEILVEPLPPGAAWDFREAVEAILESRAPAAVATIYQGTGSGADGRGGLGVLLGNGEMKMWGMDVSLMAGLPEDLARVAATKKSLTRTYSVSGGTVDVLLERIAPPLPLVLFGGGHDAPPLVRLAKELGHHVTVVDRRVDFAEARAFPGADAVLHARPGQVLDRVRISADAAVVVMNHHYETDAELLGILLNTPAAYIGMLGPRKRTGKILEELRAGGLMVTDAQMERVHAPAGLDLGSENPEQIALSILAEIQAVMSGRSGTQLRGISQGIAAR